MKLSKKRVKSNRKTRKQRGGAYSAEIWYGSSDDSRLGTREYAVLSPATERRNAELNILETLDNEIKREVSKWEVSGDMEQNKGDSLYYLFDDIGFLYFCSKEHNDYWNRIAETLETDITIFGGQSNVFDLDNSDILKQKSKKGINILAFCGSYEKAKALNVELNKEGKYFIGFKLVIHYYKTSFFACQKTFKIRLTDLLAEYKSYDDYPVNRLLKIAYSQAIKHCDKCASCDIITSDKVLEKLRIINGKIKTNEKIVDADNYFDSRFHTSCKPAAAGIAEICKGLEPDYLRFFTDLMVKLEGRKMGEADAASAAVAAKRAAAAAKQNMFRNNFLKLEKKTEWNYTEEQAKEWFDKKSFPERWETLENVKKSFNKYMEPNEHEFEPNEN